MRPSTLLVTLAVDPLPWARAQMALSLAVHILLVPLGVSWSFMMLVAERRWLKKGDEDARTLARRWSKVMAVTFAVGAVTGTVLTFEFGLLWPRFMGRFGDAFGIPFAIEGLFFFTEAIFLAIYIYGWDRLPPRAHFWTGVPIVLAGIGGTVSVIAANGWMNQPSGFTVDSTGAVVDVDPIGVMFNNAMPYEALHMLVAAYLVGGFIVASVYAVAMLKGRRDHYTRLGFLIPFTIAAIAAPVQMLVGDTVARATFKNEPTKFAAIEMVPETATDVPETIGGHMNDDGEVVGGIAIPGMASFLSGFSRSTEIQGLDAVPADDRPTIRQVNVVHWAWDIMIGMGTFLALLSSWFGFVWWRKRDLPRTKWFLRCASVAGIGAAIALESGWVVTEVGRQPWIVHGFMKVEDGATTNPGVLWSFLGILFIYTAVATATVFVLRGMARRWRTGEIGEHEVPYGPRSEPPSASVQGG